MSEKTTAKLVAAAPSVSETAIPEKVLKLAEAIKKEMKVSDTGVIETPKDLYEKLLPEDLSVAIIKKVQAHNTDFVAAQALATGEIGLKFFSVAKHENVDRVNSEVSIVKDVNASIFEREKQVPDGKGGMQTKYGVSTNRYSTYAAGGNRGSLKKVRELLSSMHEAAAKA